MYPLRFRFRAAAAGALLVALAACGGGTVPLPELGPVAGADRAALVARGEYVVRNVSVCGHCHAADPKRNVDGPLSGGMTFSNWRLGTVRAANLTPDAATGLGAWSLAEIVRAIRNGNDREGHLLAPVMPYQWLSGMSDADALAVATYLKSLPPVSNPLTNRPNLVYRMARVLFLHPERTRVAAAPPRGPTAEYGRYLADGPALCADCHTPRGGLQQAHDRDRLYAGDATPPKGFPANPANLTPDPETGTGRWSEDDFLRTLRTGVNPRGDTLHSFMPWREYRRMTDDDLRAIYRYLRTVPAQLNSVPRRAAAPQPAR
ncbi:MAG TPA: c-type cytochrome [Longimicrobium sp.]|nr:c-type cytochrome [Longimicrobium sp.]